MSRLIDLADANISLCCDSCSGAEDEAARREDRVPDRSVGDLSDGGNNLTVGQARARASAHLRKHPTHQLSWTALGAARLSPSAPPSTPRKEQP